MKQYIIPVVKLLSVKTDAYMQTMVVSNKEGYGDPMSNENSFEEGDALPTSKNVWE